jgi:hypothetical protein
MGIITLGFGQREALAAGKLYIQAYTRTHPLGTLRAALPAVGGASRFSATSR